MKKTIFALLLFAAGGMTALSASLGDALDASQKEMKREEPILGSATVNDIECAIYEASLCEVLHMPDAMRSAQRIKPSKEDQIVLFVRGKFCNKGAEKESASLPKFLSSNNKKYDGKALFYHGKESKELFIQLNPDEEYEFAVYFFLPVKGLVESKLLFEDDNPFSDTSATMDLKFNRSTPILDVLTKNGITNNPFDVRRKK